MNFSFWTLIKVFAVSLVASFIITFIYTQLPPFYVNSYNYAVVPELEQEENEFNYNGFYQSQTSSSLVESLSLFAATGDFKQTIEKDLNQSVLYLLSNTRGNSIISLRVVTLEQSNIESTNSILKSRLEGALQSSTPNNLNYSLNSLQEFNHTYTAVIPPLKFFTIIFAFMLIFSSMFLMLKRYYEEG